eukprot:TRINITY_DN13114_c0_g1_i10.p1 TRINITY_DN13114_c0_g1~~TRINITY_DN13114_c0_g1_i10.p1  ORF type:complete len:388 (-),score=37.13 TRINITY_DN13114_c0_g1_i10:119-1282(-)
MEGSTLIKDFSRLQGSNVKDSMPRHLLSPTIQILHGLNVQIVDSETDEIIAMCPIRLVSLRNQQKIDEWHDLLDRKGIPSRARIRLALQWIYSKAKYMGEIVKKWEEYIKLQDDEKQDHVRSLEGLQEPFILIQQAYNSGGYQKRQSLRESVAIYNPQGLLPQVENQAPMPPAGPMNPVPPAGRPMPPVPQQSNPIPPPPPLPPHEFQMPYDPYAAGASTLRPPGPPPRTEKEMAEALYYKYPPPELFPPPGEVVPVAHGIHPWTRITTMTMLAYSIFAIIINIIRPDFLDILVPSLFFLGYFMNRLGRLNVALICGLILLTAISDFLWLYIFSKPWWNAKDDIMLKDLPMLRRGIVVLSVIFIIGKGWVLLSLVNYRHVSNNDFFT